MKNLIGMSYKHLTRTSKHENTVLSITKIQYLLQPKMSSIPRTSKHENTILSITKMQYLFLAKITKSPLSSCSSKEYLLKERSLFVLQGKSLPC
jgi:hypothetical protein